jgi:phosphocarrier protein FPr
MVGIVLVSHSRPLALALKDLTMAMAGADLPLAISAGSGDDRSELGTDAMEILDAIQSVMSDDGVLVLMDMGSAVLSAETAIDFMDEAARARVRICSAPLIEGAVAAGVAAKIGSSLDDVATEARNALGQKSQHLQEAAPTAPVGVAASAAPAGAATTFIVTNLHGLHARPAARFIQTAARFSAEISIENLSKNRGPVSARSLSAVASLEILRNDEVRVTARGSEAREALDAVAALAQENFGEALEEKPAKSPDKGSGKRHNAPLGICDGIAIGKPLPRKRAPLKVPRDLAQDPAAETGRLRAAIESARMALRHDAGRIESRADAATAGIFEAQAVALDDPEILSHAIRSIESEHLNAARAWELSFEEIARQYRKLDDEYLRQRATDVEDVGRRVLTELGIESRGEITLGKDSILVADDLSPADVSALAAEVVQGVVLLDGARTSHGAILLRMLGIPAVAQARDAMSGVDAGALELLAFDGSTGALWKNPDAETVEKLHGQQAAFLATRQQELVAAQLPATTQDGHHLEVFANVTTADEARIALASGAGGIGLLRTEFLFLERDTAPNEEEQYQALRPVIEAMGDRPVTVRTLDAGGDKELRYLGLPREANPFLGVRALRISLRHPELFRTQLRAILRAGHQRDLRLLFPMVAGPEDFQRAAAALQAAHDELRREGKPHAWPVPTGAMIEIPSAALLAESLATVCDFFSIGTNDLTQYTLAADRGNPQLVEFQDALHPTVLMLIERVIVAAQRHKKPVAVCGEAAADPIVALVLAGLGVDELSMAPPAVAKIKMAVRMANFTALQTLAQRSLRGESAAEVRRAASSIIEKPDN